MISDVFEDEECLRIFADDQCWDEATLRQLKEEYGIFFMNGGDGVSPVMVKDKMVFIGWEDDGQIRFRKSKYHYGGFLDGFSTFWIKYLIADLKEAAKYVNEEI